MVNRPRKIYDKLLTNTDTHCLILFNTTFYLFTASGAISNSRLKTSKLPNNYTLASSAACCPCDPLRKQCVLKPAFRHMAGTCCTGHSLQGKQLRCEDVTVIYQVAFMGLRDEMEEREVDQENVEFFPVAELMGRRLDIQIGKFVYIFHCRTNRKCIRIIWVTTYKFAM